MHTFKLLLISLLVHFFASLSYAISPYAIQSVGTHPSGSQIGLYVHDTAGNQLTKAPNGSTSLTQSIYNGLITKPERITTDAGTETIKYGVGGRRYLRMHADGRETFYLNGMEYRLWGVTPQMIVHIHAQGYSPDVQVDVTDSNNPQLSYFVKDHLGSPLVTVDDAGTVLTRRRFDPWGQRTQATGGAEIPGTPGAIEKAEEEPVLTGHEAIASANLTHMNGRVFDQEIGLFLGPDPVTFPGNLVSLNTYAYVLNSGPNHTDVSGYMVDWENYSDFPVYYETESEIGPITSYDLSDVNRWSRNFLQQEHSFNGFLYRGDSRHPLEVFRDGFMPISVRDMNGPFPSKHELPLQDILAHLQDYDSSDSSIVSFVHNSSKNALDEISVYGLTEDDAFYFLYKVNPGSAALVSTHVVNEELARRFRTGILPNRDARYYHHYPVETGIFGPVGGAQIDSVGISLGERSVSSIIERYRTQLTSTQRGRLRKFLRQETTNLSRAQVAQFSHQGELNDHVINHFIGRARSRSLLP